MTTHSFIPLCRPHIPKEAYENISQVLASGKISGDGPFCHKAENQLQELLHAKHALLTSSCTHALEMSLLLLDAKPGDEVILPSFTFTSTANAVLVAGFKPVFCEIDPDTMNMDSEDVARKVTNKTRAIMPVHYAGVSCNMENLLSICAGKNIAIIEDAAQGIGAKWKEKYLGTIGEMGALSFHDTKNVICGEGGALFINEAAYFERAAIIREKGTNRSQFLRGVVDKYTWIQKGSSYILAEPLAAILTAELKIMNELNQKREGFYNFYIKELTKLEEKGILTLPKIPSYAKSNYHLFHILLKTENDRNELMAHLRARNIGATFHYIPLHSAPAGQKLGYKSCDLPITQEFSARLLRLPLFPDLTMEECFRIVSEIENWCQ